MKNMVKKLAVTGLLSMSIFGTSAVAFADASMDFKATGVLYDENNVFTLKGEATNTGDKSIETINKVVIDLTLANDAGDKAQYELTASGISVHLAPGESKPVEITFADIPYFTDATTYDTVEKDWEFTYFEAAEAAAGSEAGEKQLVTEQGGSITVSNVSSEAYDEATQDWIYTVAGAATVTIHGDAAAADLVYISEAGEMEPVVFTDHKAELNKPGVYTGMVVFGELSDNTNTARFSVKVNP
ncbi:hypothetical protein [Paenibacillus thalictri]|uniref:Uncharacterized protein n=1 Tax=Paenibacillus thalictri TaxID=2527873 RepID=A0A4Q9DNN1_9BACL|nr:hypothetical protein [Paenibacillus thalictri]TBL76509.1 hypothetical protein EYB31_18925 [Paenibacillus thalictri]